MARRTDPAVREVVLPAAAAWGPGAVREDGALRLAIVGGADALHQPREFSIPIAEEHVEAMRDDSTRYLLLWAALLPLCEAAGIGGPLDEAAAVALLDPILLGTPVEVESLFQRIRWSKRRLIAQGATVEELERGQIFDAMRSATSSADWDRVKRYDANRGRARPRGPRLSMLDAAILKYTGRYARRSAVPTRNPQAVKLSLLPEVTRVVAAAERACDAAPRSADWTSPGYTLVKKRDWELLQREVERALRSAHPQLADVVVRSVSSLVCTEATDGARTA